MTLMNTEQNLSQPGSDQTGRRHDVRLWAELHAVIYIFNILLEECELTSLQKVLKRFKETVEKMFKLLILICKQVVLK